MLDLSKTPKQLLYISLKGERKTRCLSVRGKSQRRMEMEKRTKDFQIQLWHVKGLWVTIHHAYKNKDSTELTQNAPQAYT